MVFVIVSKCCSVARTSFTSFIAPMSIFSRACRGDNAALMDKAEPRLVDSSPAVTSVSEALDVISCCIRPNSKSMPSTL